jgi:hypothetical protein
MADDAPPKPPGEIATISSGEAAEAGPSSASPSSPTLVPEKLRSIGKWAERLLAVLGVIAIFAELYHLVIKPVFLERRSITAAYSPYTVAEATPIFDIAPLLRPEFAIAKRLVEMDLLFWNSGTQTIPESDVRRPVTIKVSAGSRIVQQRPGKVFSEQPDSFNLKEIDPATYELRWNALEPDDYFETHLLIATDIDANDFEQIIRIDGLITGRLGVALLDFDKSMEDRNLVAYVIGLALFVSSAGLSILFGTIMPTPRKEKRSKFVRMASVLFVFLITVGGSATVAVIGGPWIASSFYAVPKWAPVTAYPPYFLKQIQLPGWWGGALMKKDYSSRWSH